MNKLPNTNVSKHQIYSFAFIWKYNSLDHTFKDIIKLKHTSHSRLFLACLRVKVFKTETTFLGYFRRGNPCWIRLRGVWYLNKSACLDCRYSVQSRRISRSKMNNLERQLLEKRLQHFQYDVEPSDLLPHLNCLTPQDEERIRADERNYGPIRANQTLVNLLQRRRNSFKEFVRALKKTDSEHVALLFDPHGNGKFS